MWCGFRWCYACPGLFIASAAEPSSRGGHRQRNRHRIDRARRAALGAGRPLLLTAGSATAALRGELATTGTHHLGGRPRGGNEGHGPLLSRCCGCGPGRTWNGSKIRTLPVVAGADQPPGRPRSGHLHRRPRRPVWAPKRGSAAATASMPIRSSQRHRYGEASTDASSAARRPAVKPDRV
jgi:hypothetical protein